MTLAKFIVHIGDGKCGSSAMQAALFDASDRLTSLGLLYRSHHRTSGNYCFGTLVGSNTRGNDKVQRQIALRVISELRKKVEDAEYVIVSSEAFLTLGPDRVIKILRMIDNSVERLDVIAYVRDPLGMYLSLAQQAVKASFRFRRPDTYVRPLDNFLHSWASHPEVDTVTVRQFDRSMLIGGNAVADFESILQTLTGKTEIGLEHINENTSLSAEQMVVLQDFRRRFQAENDGKRSPVTSRLMDFFAAMNESGIVGTKPTLSRNAAAWVIQNNGEIIDRLNSRYGLQMQISTMEDQSLLVQKWEHISSILESVDARYVHNLKMLVPSFNSDMAAARRSLQKIIELAPGKRDEIERAAETYWSAEMLAGLILS